MRTVFITGAGGFAGSRLIDHLKAQGYEAVAGVRNRARKLAYERQNGRALVCDITDPINVARAIASVRPDGVIHLACMASPADALREPLEACQSIVGAWANVLDAVRRCVPRAKVVLASACDVYGPSPDGQPLREDAPLRPVSTFGSFKATAESVAQTFFRDYHLNITIARPFHYTGPGQSDRAFFAAAARRLAKWDPSVDGGELRLPDLNCRRDLLHVDDVVAAYERLLVDGKPNEVYNICSGQTVTCREVIEALVAESGVNVQTVDAPPSSREGRERETQIPVLCGDNGKLTNELNWRPTRTVRQAATELLQSCRSNAPALAS